MKMLITILIILVLAYGFFYVKLWPKEGKGGMMKVTTYQKIQINQGKLYMDKQVTESDIPRQAALSKIEVEVRKHFPDMKRSGMKLELVQLEKIEGAESIWFAQYDTPEGNDMSVEIKMDIVTGEVIHYQDSWS